MNSQSVPFFIDAHQDLAYHCQEHNRELEDPGGVPCQITLPLLESTGVRLAFATLFVSHTHSREARRELLEEQWRMYEGWLARYPERMRLIRSQGDLAALRLRESGPPAGPIGLVTLMEGCELLETPAELERWVWRGMRVAGLTWNGVSHYASGTFGDGSGLTPAGFELLAEMRRLGVILDLAHLADAGVADALSRWDGPVCATHCNARALCDSPRNLPDETIREVGRRGGVVGLVMLASFIRTGWKDGDPLPSLAETLDHTGHVAALIGRDKVGIGSDLDGGLTPLNTPEGIDRICDLPRLTDELAARGWSAEELAGFAGGNWLSFLERALPA